MHHCDPSEDAWMVDALCAEIGGIFWYPEKGESLKEAREICGRCPVRTECLEYAMFHRPGIGDWGIWSGTTELERVRMARDARRAQSQAAA